MARPSLQAPVFDAPLLQSVQKSLEAQGFCYVPAFSTDATGHALVALAGSLGPLYLPPDVDPVHPAIETRPAADASYLSPFDRAEAIGWHNDFSTHTERPRWSLAYLARADPKGPEHGAWRVASCEQVLGRLHATREGSEVMRFLRDTPLPYSFTGDGSPAYFHPIEPRGPRGERLGLRFYGRAMRDGARLAYGTVPERIEHALRLVEAAADEVGQVLAASAGALLVTDNWRSLHDRLAQSVHPGMPLRRSLLCFVSS